MSALGSILIEEGWCISIQKEIYHNHILGQCLAYAQEMAVVDVPLSLVVVARGWKDEASRKQVSGRVEGKGGKRWLGSKTGEKGSGECFKPGKRPEMRRRLPPDFICSPTLESPT